MRNPDKPRKPQINVEVTIEEKEILEKAAKARGFAGVSSLMRTLALDEARRLGIS